MWDISAFMKVLKLRYFRLVQVEGKRQALRAMAAYLDLNPVRAKIYDAPRDYRWCGYAEAVGFLASLSPHGGKLSQADYLRCKVRYFSDGAVIGGKAFVEEMFAAFRDRFGPKRKDRALPLRGLAGETKDEWLFNFRQLRTGVFGSVEERPVSISMRLGSRSVGIAVSEVRELLNHCGAVPFRGCAVVLRSRNSSRAKHPHHRRERRSRPRDRPLFPGK